jgi:predicted GTPase
MPVIAVAGACSRAGKTALAEAFLRALPPGQALALKFTTTADVFQRCPRGAPCVVCDIDVPFRLVSESAILDEPGTDTQRLALAGARRVVWVIARASAVAPAWQAAARALDLPSRLAVLEGSTIVEHARPELTLFVVHPFLSHSRWKPTSQRLIASADAVVVNLASSQTRGPSRDVMRAIERARPRDLRIADVTRGLHEWAPDLQARASALLAAATPTSVPAPA